MLIHASLGFASLSDKDLDSFAEKIEGHVYSLPGNPVAPVLQATLHAALEDFTAKISAAALGGKADTAAKNNSRRSCSACCVSWPSSPKVWRTTIWKRCCCPASTPSRNMSKPR